MSRYYALMRPPRLASILDGFRLRKSYAGGLIGVTADATRKLDEAPRILRVGVRPLGRPWNSPTTWTLLWTTHTHQRAAKIHVPGPAPSVFSED